jgi:hypothetical protein
VRHKSQLKGKREVAVI